MFNDNRTTGHEENVVRIVDLVMCMKFEKK